MDINKLGDIKKTVEDALQSVWDDPEFECGEEDPWAVVALRVAVALYPLVDVDFFRNHRAEVLRRELAALMEPNPREAKVLVQGGSTVDD